MSAGSQLLLVEAEALPPVLASAAPEDYDLPTVCTGWSVRDVLAHCASALSNLVQGTSSSYSPEDNQRDVDLRSSWPVDRVIDELLAGYAAAAAVIEDASGRRTGWRWGSGSTVATSGSRCAPVTRTRAPAWSWRSR